MKFLLLLIAFLYSPVFSQVNNEIRSSNAQPDPFVFVIRPLDAWSPNSNTQKDSLQMASDKKAAFELYLTSNPKSVIGGYKTGMFGKITDHPIAHMAEHNLEEKGFSITSSNNFTNTVFIAPPTEVDPKKIQAIATAQNRMYEMSIINSGNPLKLEEKERASRFFAGLTELATFAIVGNKFGATASSQLTLGSGIAGDIGDTVQKYSGTLIAQRFDAPNLNEYQTAELRQVKTARGTKYGLILIAYKNGKTQEAENKALTQAVVSLAGADTTVEAIEKARAEDYATRLKVWDDCVKRGECKGE